MSIISPYGTGSMLDQAYTSINRGQQNLDGYRQALQNGHNLTTPESLELQQISLNHINTVNSLSRLNKMQADVIKGVMNSI
jgi:hypothetical protein